jgi:hypothetical protein
MCFIALLLREQSVRTRNLLYSRNALIGMTFLRCERRGIWFKRNLLWTTSGMLTLQPKSLNIVKPCYFDNKLIKCLTKLIIVNTIYVVCV